VLSQGKYERILRKSSEYFINCIPPINFDNFTSKKYKMSAWNFVQKVGISLIMEILAPQTK
jgi:hypothetical protein